MSFNSLQTGRHIQTFKKDLSPPLERRRGFNSLQTGRHIQTDQFSQRQYEERYTGFNSLQTGRHIQTRQRVIMKLLMSGFQFPSNGKAHSDHQFLSPFLGLMGGSVSIPFKREGTFRLLIGLFPLCLVYRVSIPFKREGTFRLAIHSNFLNIGFGFNSLQTGRHIQTRFLMKKACTYIEVSIPFKREGTFRQKIWSFFMVKYKLFQFPSNGKAHSDRPQFQPSGAVAPDTPKPNTNCARLFFRENLPPKRHKPP